ncbi:hypothetical protein LOC67_24655 [Stieleria sp. JC731]|uniref:hypothetical protein n=1 Tax=Pirellulaceae TaxID=2691357 RepID=UPI001E3A779F|nr:hypothetical protein [Stieleria sp. JC731]MCC9603754.1 hypothetical protein [Stieleria sp. JC731]
MISVVSLIAIACFLFFAGYSQLTIAITLILIFGISRSIGVVQWLVERQSGRAPAKTSNRYDATYFIVAFGSIALTGYFLPGADLLLLLIVWLCGSIFATAIAQLLFGEPRKSTSN